MQSDHFQVALRECTVLFLLFGWLGRAMKDAEVGLRERWGCWLRVGDGLIRGGYYLLWLGFNDRLGGEYGSRSWSAWVVWMQRVNWIDPANDGKDRQRRRSGEGILEREGGLDSALPEAGQQQEEQA